MTRYLKTTTQNKLVLRPLFQDGFSEPHGINRSVLLWVTFINLLYLIQTTVSPSKGKVFPEPQGRELGADLHFCSPQPDTAETAWPQTRGQFVARCACLSASFCQYQIILLGDRGNGMRETCLPRFSAVVLWLRDKLAPTQMQIYILPLHHRTIQTHRHSAYHTRHPAQPRPILHSLCNWQWNKYQLITVPSYNVIKHTLHSNIKAASAVDNSNLHNSNFGYELYI